MIPGNDWQARAGASDRDREAWLAQRRTGVTATDVARLARAGDVDAAIASLVAEKKGRAKPFKGNAYTEWGKEREPDIASELLVFDNFQPESRVFHAAENPRHLASPDAVRETDDGFVVLGEFKTSGQPLDAPSVRKKGYEDQCHWQMYVMGAAAVHLRWELRIGEPGSFMPGYRESLLIVRDDDRIAELVALADRLLAALDADTEPVVDHRLAELVAAVLDAKAEVAAADEALRQYLTEHGVKKAALGFASVSFTAGSARQSFNREQFEQDHPGVYATYLQAGAKPKPRLTVTAAKEATE